MKLAISPYLFTVVAGAWLLACETEHADDEDAHADEDTNGHGHADDDGDDHAGEPGDHDHEDRMASGAECPETSPPTYGDFAADFFADYCTRCHHSALFGADRNEAPEGVNFDTLEGIRAHALEIDQTAAKGPAATNVEMPVDGSMPTEAERERLGQWLACGAPRDGAPTR
jgi:hypothetical protein